MDAWTVIRIQNRFSVLLFGYIETIFYADNIFSISPPLHYQLHGLNRIFDDFTLYVFGESSTILSTFPGDKPVKKISSLKLWKMYKKWKVSAYICVISKGISILYMKRQVKSFVHSLPTLTCKPVFILDCGDTCVQHEKDRVFEDIQTCLKEQGTLTEYTIICKCKDIQQELTRVMHAEFFRFLPILDDKLASIEKKINEDIERGMLDKVNIVETITSFLQYLDTQDLDQFHKSETAIHGQIGNMRTLMHFRTQRVNIVRMIFDIIEENINISDRSVLKRAIERTFKKYSGEVVQDKIISISCSVFVELLTTSKDVTLISSLVSMACILYLSYSEYNTLIKQTLSQFNQNARETAENIAYYYEEVLRDKLKFKDGMKSFRMALGTLRISENHGHNLALEMSKTSSSSNENVYICKTCKMRHSSKEARDSLHGLFHRLQNPTDEQRPHVCLVMKPGNLSSLLMRFLQMILCSRSL